MLFKTLKLKEDKKITYVNEEKNKQTKFPRSYLQYLLFQKFNM